MNLIILFLVIFFITYASGFLFKNLAQKLDILDKPGPMKFHKKPTPLLGGVVIYLGLVVGVLLKFSELRFLLGMLSGATVILIMGVIDDIRGLSARLRLTVQAVVIIAMMGMGMRLSFLPNNWWGNVGEIILTLIWMMGITNAFNHLDGIDGLAAVTALLAALFFAVISYQTGFFGMSLIGLILIASCLGFLPHNFAKKKMFLGDAGATLLGFVLAGMAIMGNWAEDSVVKVIVPVLILGVPIFDMTFTTIMRIREGNVHTVVEWFEFRGRDHFHHRLIALGIRSGEVVLFIAFIAFSFGISALMVSNEKAIVGALAIFQAGIIFAVIGILMVMGGRRRHRRRSTDL